MVHVSVNQPNKLLEPFLAPQAAVANLEGLLGGPTAIHSRESSRCYIRNVYFSVFIAIFVLKKEKENGGYKVNWIQLETLRNLGTNRITVLKISSTKSPKVLGKVTLTK